MKRRYFKLEDFIDFLKDLKVGEVKKLHTESMEDGEVRSYSFKKDIFNGNTFILYDSFYGEVGIIQDTSMISWEDFAEGTFEVLEMNGEYKVFIEEE